MLFTFNPFKTRFKKKWEQLSLVRFFSPHFFRSSTNCLGWPLSSQMCQEWTLFFFFNLQENNEKLFFISFQERFSLCSLQSTQKPWFLTLCVSGMFSGKQFGPYIDKQLTVLSWMLELPYNWKMNWLSDKLLALVWQVIYTLSCGFPDTDWLKEMGQSW